MSRTFVIRLEDDELLEAENRYGSKNIGYEIGKAFRANLKRIRNIEYSKALKRDNARISRAVNSTGYTYYAELSK
jgi:hypothetical protein